MKWSTEKIPKGRIHEWMIAKIGSRYEHNTKRNVKYLGITTGDVFC